MEEVVYTLELSKEEVQVVYDAMLNGIYRQTKPVIDKLIAEANKKGQEQQKKLKEEISDKSKKAVEENVKE